MTYQELMERQKTHSDASDLDAEEMQIYRAFLELAVTKRDVEILSRAWLKHHRRMGLQRV